MTDIQGVERTTASPPPVESGRADIPNAIDHGSDEENIRAATAELRKQREQEGEIDDIGKRPITQFHYDGHDKEPKSLRQATTDISDYRRVRKPDAQLAIDHFGGDPAEVLARAKDSEFIRQIRPDWTVTEAEHYSRTGEEPPTKVGLVKDNGQLVRPLTDDQPIGPYDALQSRSELKRGVRAFRQAQAEEQQRLISEFTATQERQQAAAAAQEQTSPEQPQPQPQESQQPDERQKLQAQLEAERFIRNSSFEEQRAAREIERWQTWAHQNFPELTNENAIRAATPARQAQLQQAGDQIRRGINSWMAHGAAATQARERQEQQVAVHNQALVQHVYKQFADSQDALFARQAPEMSNPAKARELCDATLAMLRGVGLADAEVQRAWKGQTGVPLRDARVQMILRKAALWDQAQARVKNVTKAAPPPVMRPGTYRPSGAGDLETVQRLQRELQGATGDRAVRLGTKLQQARRAAGM
jgi:hypothetical protein